MSTIDRRHFLALLMGSAAAACGDDAGSAPTSDAGFYLSLIHISEPTRPY